MRMRFAVTFFHGMPNSHVVLLCCVAGTTDTYKATCVFSGDRKTCESIPYYDLDHACIRSEHTYLRELVKALYQPGLQQCGNASWWMVRIKS